MKESYQIVDRKDSRAYAGYLAKNGQLLLPLVELIEASRMAVDELIDVLGRASIEAVLQLSAAGVAGEKHQGRPISSNRTVNTPYNSGNAFSGPIWEGGNGSRFTPTIPLCSGKRPLENA